VTRVRKHSWVSGQGGSNLISGVHVLLPRRSANPTFISPTRVLLLLILILILILPTTNHDTCVHAPRVCFICRFPAPFCALSIPTFFLFNIFYFFLVVFV
ncbi:unnamed protein product, partial [Ascophyllum nodosum]